MAHYLICYDIADPKRLAKVHRRTVSSATFVQYSVYYFQGSQVELKAVLDDLQSVICNAEDDIRAYAIASIKEAILRGKSWLPDDLYLI